MGAFFPGNALFQFQVYREYSRRCFSWVMFFLVVRHRLHLPRPRSESPRHEDPPEKGEEKGGLCSEIAGTLSGREQGVDAVASPRPTKSEQRDKGPASRACRRQASGERGNLRTWVWVYIGPTRLDMTPKTRSGDRYDAGLAVLREGGFGKKSPLESF